MLKLPLHWPVLWKIQGPTGIRPAVNAAADCFCSKPIPVLTMAGMGVVMPIEQADASEAAVNFEYMLMRRAKA